MGSLTWRIVPSSIIKTTTIIMEMHISERDEAGRDIATYVSSKDSDRIEFIV